MWSETWFLRSFGEHGHVLVQISIPRAPTVGSCSRSVGPADHYQSLTHWREVWWVRCLIAQHPSKIFDTCPNGMGREVQTVDMKCRPGNGIEGSMVCTSLGSLLRPLFYFLDDVSYPQSVEATCSKCCSEEPIDGDNIVPYTLHSY